MARARGTSPRDRRAVFSQATPLRWRERDPRAWRCESPCPARPRCCPQTMQAAPRSVSPLEHGNGPQRMPARLSQRELHQAFVESRVGPSRKDVAEPRARQAEGEDAPRYIDPIRAAEGFDQLGAGSPVAADLVMLADHVRNLGL